MDAIVLAGGEGTRLRPLTEQRPKCLVPILGRPLLGLLLGQLQRHGVRRAVLALTHGASSAAIARAFEEDRTLGGALASGPGTAFDLRFAFEETPLGSGGAIANAVSALDDPSDPVLVCNGDLVSDIDLTAMVASHRERGAELTIALSEVAEPSRFGVAELDVTGRITAFVEKPAPGDEPSNLANAGFWLFSSSLLASLDGGSFNRVEDVLFPALARSKRPVFGFRHEGHWRDIGAPEAYRATVMDALDRLGQAAGAGGGLEGGSWIDASARVDERASVRRSAIEARTKLEAGASVRESVLWEDVRVGAGARVTRSVLGAGFEVPPGALVEDVCLVPPSAPAASSNRPARVS